MATLEEHKRWRTPRLEALVWWCQDDVCDCTRPEIVRVTPNERAGYPWVHRELLWEGKFLSGTYEYAPDEREELQYAPLRAACERFGIPVPSEAAAPA